MATVEKIVLTNVTTSEVTNMVTSESGLELFYGRHDFLSTWPGLAIPSYIILFIAALTGTFGNVLTLLVISNKKGPRRAEAIFIINLAISDLYVTVVADPMSLVAKLEGKEFFDRIPGLCQTIASMCTISCVTSLMTIGLLSFNRYIYICVNKFYERIFCTRKCIFMCLCVYLVGTILVLLNAAGIGDHGYDSRSLECIWNRMETYPYTVVFSIALVWIPSVVIGICYLKIYLYVRAHKKRMRQQSEYGKSTSLKSFQLARTLFVIYAVFITCWAPYALLIVIDTQNTFPHEVHICITMFAHLHPSLNWVIYYCTNKKFAASYRETLKRIASFCTTEKDDTRGSRDNITSNVTSGGHLKFKSHSKEETHTLDSGVIVSEQTTQL